MDAGEEMPRIVNTIVHGKLVPIDLNIATINGELGIYFKKKPRLVGTFIKGVLTEVNLDSIEAREEKEREEQKHLLG